MRLQGITGFPCPLSSCRITLLWLDAFGFVDHKEAALVQLPKYYQCLPQQSTGLG